MRRIWFLIALLAISLIVSPASNTKREGVHMFYQSEENGDYKLYIFPIGKVLVCEDPTHDPLIIECKHESRSWIKSVRPVP